MEQKHPDAVPNGLAVLLLEQFFPPRPERADLYKAARQSVEEALAGSFLDELPARLIGDRAYDADALDQSRKKKYDIELIAPHRRQRKVKTPDGRKLRRYSRRWRVGRLFAWLHWFRRLVARYEYYIENFLGFVHLACLVLLLKHLGDAKC